MKLNDKALEAAIIAVKDHLLKEQVWVLSVMKQLFMEAYLAALSMGEVRGQVPSGAVTDNSVCTPSPATMEGMRYDAESSLQRVAQNDDNVSPSSTMEVSGGTCSTSPSNGTLWGTPQILSNWAQNANRKTASTETSAKQQSSDWQPIASAPRDGTKIDIWGTYGDMTGRWCDCSWTGEFWFAAYAMDCGDTLHDATHWMPLPTPPIQTEGDKS